MEHIQADIYNKSGLDGGAVGASSLADIKHLSKAEALDLFNITYALEECSRIRVDLRRIITDNGQRNLVWQHGAATAPGRLPVSTRFDQRRNWRQGGVHGDLGKVATSF